MNPNLGTIIHDIWYYGDSKWDYQQQERLEALLFACMQGFVIFMVTFFALFLYYFIFGFIVGAIAEANVDAMQEKNPPVEAT